MNDNKTKLNININVLPDKYRGTVIKFKHVVIVLGSLCAIFIIALFYQIVLDSMLATDLLNNENALITSRFDLRLQEQQELNSMQATINELNEIIDKKDVLAADLAVITTAEEDANVEVTSIKHSGDKIELSCDASYYQQQSGSYQAMLDSLYSFEESLVEYSRFLVAEHDTVSYVPDSLTITITVNLNA